MRHLKSLREYLDALAELGEVKPIDTEVDWDLEMGAVIRRSYDLKAPAPLFNRVKGVEAGFRALGAPAGVSRQPGLYLCRVAVSLGLDPRASAREIVEALATAHDCPPVKPRAVPTGPCKENVLLGDAADLTRLPVPLIHGGDGGRYINTYGTIVARTPDGRWTNWSIARVMMLDARRMSGIVSPYQHIGKIHAMWKALGKDMPFALALGVEPAVSFVSGMPLPDYADEADYLGGYFGEPIDVVRCETVDLHVPATAEIVVEGHLSASEKAPEGPMGEYAGYIWKGKATPKPVYHVSAMTYRNDPILPVVAAGEPVEEDHTAWGIPAAAQVVRQLRATGLPVTTAWAPFEAANHWLAVTFPRDWRERTGLGADALCQAVGKEIFDTHVGEGFLKVIVLEDDVNPADTAELVWAYATRCHPGSGEVLFDERKTSALAVYLTAGEKGVMASKKAVYNCLTIDEWVPGHRPSRVSFRHGWPADIQERVLANWRAYGYTG